MRNGGSNLGAGPQREGRVQPRIPRMSWRSAATPPKRCSNGIEKIRQKGKPRHDQGGFRECSASARRPGHSLKIPYIAQSACKSLNWWSRLDSTARAARDVRAANWPRSGRTRQRTTTTPTMSRIRRKRHNTMFSLDFPPESQSKNPHKSTIINQ